MKTPLPEALQQKEIELGRAFRAAKLAGDFGLAERILLDTWDIYPQPKHGNQGVISLVSNISNFFFELGRYPEAEWWASEIFKCDPPRDYHRPFLMLGKIYLEWGKTDVAAENLVKAFEMGGRRGFVGEEPKYLKFAQAQMKK